MVFTLHKKMWLIVAVLDDEVLRGLWGKGAELMSLEIFFSLFLEDGETLPKIEGFSVTG